MFSVKYSIYIYITQSIYKLFYIINSNNKINDNEAESLGEIFAHLPKTLHTLNLNLR
jgi:hypothetical protein